MNWGVIVLAAGMSSRMGRQKLLLPWGATTVLGRVLETIAEAMAGRTASAIVVTGSDEDAVRAEIANHALGLPFRWVHNSDYRDGQMIGSLRVGLQSLSDSVNMALLVLGDQPQLSAHAATAVIDAAENSGALIVAPVHHGRRGHPWAIGRELWEELIRADKACDFLDTRQSDVKECAADESVLKDLDTPDEYLREAPA